MHKFTVVKELLSRQIIELKFIVVNEKEQKNLRYVLFNDGKCWNHFNLFSISSMQV